MAGDNYSSPTPLTPPHSEEDRLDRLRLLRSHRVGVATFFRLIAEHGSAAAALAALPDVANKAGVQTYTPYSRASALAEVKRARAKGARMISWGEADYPKQLMQISDAPPFFWATGAGAVLSRPMIALVGARNASSLGTRMAKRLAEDLAVAGYTVVSGLARGVDTAAHYASLPQGTLAVLAGGVDIIYPAENTKLAEDICKTGLLISEQPMGLVPTARHFPRRNRLISGLAQAVVVVEAAAKSGSLITARNALDQGRDVMAVPGHPFDARASGCNMLIRDGAQLVRCAADVIEALPKPIETPPPELDLPQPTEPASQPTRSLRETAALHSQILARLGPSPLAEDQLIRDMARPAGQVTPEIVTLELEGKIARQPGGLLSLLN